MAFLNWISDTDLINAVEGLLSVAVNAKKNANKDFGKNVIDPFSATFEMAGFKMNFDDWVFSEQARQAQKSLQNFVGEFHQIVLGSCNNWQNMERGNIVDLLCSEKKIIAEVKNKFNTISGGKLADLYWSLESAVMNKTSIYKYYTAYYVSIIPDKPERYNKEFTPSDKEKGQKCPVNEFIRQIDGASFYELVTGDESALENLFDVIPDVIEKLTKLKGLDRDKLKGLFKSAYG